jgi:quercetin dioxygenase-like cupin family protein
MKNDKSKTAADKEIVFIPGKEIESSEKEWYKHPACKGVYLKDLLTGKDTGGKFSYHLVRIEKNCEIPSHDHKTEWELNRLISGKGAFIFTDKEIMLAPGQTFATPPGISHAVSSYDNEVLLLAMFLPALN